MFAFLAAVKRGHWLVCRSGLHLEEVRSLVLAFWTCGLRRISTLPCRIATKNIVNLLLRKVANVSLNTCDHAMNVGTSAAFEA